MEHQKSRHHASRIHLFAILLMLLLPALLWHTPSVFAQSWPSRQVIKIVVPWPAGGAADFLGRQLGPALSQQIGQQVIIENKAGAATNIGSDAVAKAEPDGYTLLMASSNNAVNMTLFKKMSYDTARDFVPVALVGYTPMVLVVHPSVKANTLSEFVQLAKANPGKLLYASAGNGSPAHLAAEKLLRAAGIQMVHVPYKGAAPAVVDLIGGQVHLLITNLPASIEHIKSGRLKALAITGKASSPTLPTVPTFDQAGLPNYDANAWYGIVAPKATPASIVNRLAEAVTRAMDDPMLAKRIEQQGVQAATRGSPEEFGRLIADDIASYRKLLTEANIRAD